MEFDSAEEEAFYNWCLEAKSLGLITKIKYQEPVINILEKKYYIEEKQLKTKIKKSERVLCNGLSYTPDFYIEGDLSLFHTTKNKLLKFNNYYLIDIKGSFLGGDRATKFNLLQKVIYEINGEWINRLIPNDFFKVAWLPMPYKETHRNKRGSLMPNFCYKKNLEKRKLFKDCLNFEEWKKINQ